MDNIYLIKIIKSKLKEQNITQAKLADKIGVSTSQVSHYLTGENDIPFQNMVKICKLLNINLNVIYGIDNYELSSEELWLIQQCRKLDDKDKSEWVGYLNYLVSKHVK